MQQLQNLLSKDTADAYEKLMLSGNISKDELKKQVQEQVKGVSISYTVNQWGRYSPDYITLILPNEWLSIGCAETFLTYKNSDGEVVEVHEDADRLPKDILRRKLKDEKLFIIYQVYYRDVPNGATLTVHFPNKVMPIELDFDLPGKNATASPTKMRRTLIIGNKKETEEIDVR